MSTTVLLLVRHGATPANLCRPYTLQGLVPDGDLAEVGIAQAEAAAAALQAFPIAKVYSSPLRRAWQTARPIAAAVGEGFAIEPGLAEADTGLWTGLTWQQVEQRWPEEYLSFRNDAERHGYLGGENMVQVRDRVLPAVEDLVSRHPEETIVAVSHGVVNRVLLAHWLGIPLRFARRLPQDNAAFNVVEFTDGECTVRTLNQATHLAHLLCEAA
jgi:broad specificity phosphatase PhoE